MKWDKRFLNLAEFIARQWSKDPSTQTGAVIVRGKRVVSLGFNGFPEKIKDCPIRLHDRPTKYALTIHCEINAILLAGQPVTGCTLYTWPFMSCTRCAVQVIQSGITRVVAPSIPPHLVERWGEDLKTARLLFEEAGVSMEILDQ